MTSDKLYEEYVVATEKPTSIVSDELVKAEMILNEDSSQKFPRYFHFSQRSIEENDVNLDATSVLLEKSENQ